MASRLSNLKPGQTIQLNDEVGLMVETAQGQETPQECYVRLLHQYPDRYVIHMEAVVTAADPVERLHQMIKEQKMEMTVETYIQFRFCVHRTLAERARQEMNKVT
jgi:hypothetical protein